MSEASLKLDELFELTGLRQASDLHLVAGRHPSIRVDGQLVSLVNEAVLSPDQTEAFAFTMVSPQQKAEFLENGELDLAYDFKGKARFRVNIYREQGFIAVACRLIPSNIRTLSELNLPKTLSHFTERSQGLVLMTGPIGHGKSTSLAALLDIINHSRNVHILTIEDPIEYVFEPDRAIITQREVKKDTKNFHAALTHAFRQDIDVIMIGEMRDPETMATAITAAETGHLVFTTLHTNSAAQTVDRIIDSFPAFQQPQIRTQLAAILLGVVSQRLIPRIEGGRIPACELMIANSAIRNLIRENKTHQIDTVIGTSFEEGMISLDKYLADLVSRGEISLEYAELYSINKNGIRGFLAT